MENKNECGECTLCCTLLNVPLLNKPAGTPCEHLCDTGCSIYEERFAPCRKFECAWLKSNANVALRPNNCGVIFFEKDGVMFGVADNRDTHYHIFTQIQQFIKQGYGIVIVKHGLPNLINMEDKMHIFEEVIKTNILK